MDGWMDGRVMKKNQTTHFTSQHQHSSLSSPRPVVQPCDFVVAAMGVLVGVRRDGVGMGVGRQHTFPVALSQHHSHLAYIISFRCCFDGGLD